jgi:very-short-patch-repair endonuclease
MRAPRKPDRTVARARELRRSMTEAEKKLWWQLRQLPVETSHFRRQAAIGPYFADFACHQRRLVIEVDGGGHGEARQIAFDETRTAYLRSRGYRVLRFWNNEVLKEIEGVMSVIYAAIHDKEAPPTPDPSPPRAARAGGGEPRGCTPFAKRMEEGEPEAPS